MDGQSHLLLIRDEGGPPEAQVSTAAQFCLEKLDWRRLSGFPACTGLAEFLALRFTERKVTEQTTSSFSSS